MLKLVVLSCLMAAASAALLTPFAPFAPLAYSGAVVAPWYGSNYRGPLSLAPGQPANILAADGRPLDTLDVNLDRSAHFTAKALDGVHLLKKRSAPVIAPLGGIAYAGTPVITHGAHLAYSAPIVAPSNYRGPLSLAPGQPANILAADGRPLDTLDVNLDRSAHLTAKALDGVHLLKKRSASLIAPLGRIAYAGAPVITHAAPLAYSAPIVAPYHTPLIHTAGHYAHYL
ncbi:uncharacterized protein LOC134745489 [Cydia strobilella]|uniref:uncharacterized protein LOC134745489 n=1 Tax=Cydia strobilella TaxID=1100964 RepID=UPI00300561BC